MIQDSKPSSASDPQVAGAVDHGGEQSATDLLRLINEGRMQVADLSLDQRRRCVGYLTVEGYSVSEIARLMNMAERTVARDRAAARRDEAIAPDLYLGDELLGEYHRITLASVQRLTRLARDPATPPYARLWAEDAISRCYQRLIDVARDLKYIETGDGRLTHQRATDPGEKQRKEELDEARKQMLNKPIW